MATSIKPPLLADVGLWDWLCHISRGNPIAIDDDRSPPWFEPGVVCEVSEETYCHFRELFARHWIRDSVFVCGDNSGSLRLFWRGDGKFFGRQLTSEEAAQFSRLSGVPLQL